MGKDCSGGKIYSKHRKIQLFTGLIFPLNSLANLELAPLVLRFAELFSRKISSCENAGSSCVSSIAGIVAGFAIIGICFQAGAVAASPSSTSPHFASLKASRVEIRRGPGYKKEILWTYHQPGMPVEIIGSQGKWRLIRDSSGARGWAHHRMLSALRMALVAPQARKGSQFILHRQASASSPAAARLEPGVLLLIRKCNGKWCEVSASGFGGWIEQANIWGTYPGEIIK